MPEISDDVVARLGAIPTSTLCDAVIKAGIRKPERVIVEGVQPVLPRTVRAVGRARTERRALVRDPSRLWMARDPKLKGGVSDRANPGDFLVVTGSPGPHAAIFGGMLALTAKLRRVAGVLVDGATRDAPEIIEHNLPVWARSFTPMPGGYCGYSVVEVDGPVVCGGVEILPGDIIVADGDGIIVVPASDVATILPICEEMQAAEDKCARDIAQGASLHESYPSRSYYWKPEKTPG
jgi:regulator of RNase E activity RraA